MLDDLLGLIWHYGADNDFSIQCHEIEIEILKKLRENIKFDSQEELVEQMKRDEVEAREYFSKQ